MTSSALNKMSLVEQSQISDNSEEIKSILRGLLDAKELTLRDISKFTGFASPTISQALSGQYEGDIGKLEDALARFYRNWVASNLIIETSVVKQIHGTMGLAWKRKLICRITGHFGCGKSKASARYVALNSDTSAYVELVSTTTPTSLMHRIAEALNIESQMSGSQNDKLSAIIRNLQRKPRQLVIDEADNLKARTLAILKDIHGGEEAGRCSIVLLGTERLKTLLRDPVLGYLRRRITLQCEVGDISFEEAKLIMNFWPNKLDKEDLKEAWGRALKKYGVATMVAIMARAFDMAQYHGKKFIDDKCLAEAYDMVLD